MRSLNLDSRPVSEDSGSELVVPLGDVWGDMVNFLVGKMG